MRYCSRLSARLFPLRDHCYTHTRTGRQTDRLSVPTRMGCVYNKKNGEERRAELAFGSCRVVRSQHLSSLSSSSLLFCCTAFDCVGQRRREARIFIGAHPASLLYDDAHICIRLHLTKEEEEEEEVEEKRLEKHRYQQGLV